MKTTANEAKEAKEAKEIAKRARSESRAKVNRLSLPESLSGFVLFTASPLSARLMFAAMISRTIAPDAPRSIVDHPVPSRLHTLVHLIVMTD
jgi:hypothetical protein